MLAYSALLHPSGEQLPCCELVRALSSVPWSLRADPFVGDRFCPSLFLFLMEVPMRPLTVSPFEPLLIVFRFQFQFFFLLSRKPEMCALRLPLPSQVS